MEKIEFNGVPLFRWNCGPSTFLARPELGARLMNWNVRMSDTSVRDVIHWPENADFDKFAKVRGGNPVLFPFSARTYNDGKIGFWKDQEGIVRPMPQHGFARDGNFEVVFIDEKGFAAKLIPSQIAQEAYPFKYSFIVRYIFEEICFKVFFELENHDDKPILWSAGHHFYFTLPWHEELSRKDYHFEVPAKKSYTHAPDGSLQPIKPFSNKGSFGDAGISDNIFSKLNGDQAVFGPKGGEENIGIRILGDSDEAQFENTFSSWNAFVIWTEADNSPFYCVEPWMGPPNSPEHGKGLHAVNPGSKSCFGVEVTLL